MTHRFPLSVRNTHRYVGTYADLDEWSSIGYATLVSRMDMVDEDDMCENTVSTLQMTIELDGTHSEDVIKQALRDSLSKSGCAHDYDCCGCWSTYVRDVQHLNDTWIVTQSSSRNY